jgi:hypothetical protein
MEFAGRVMILFLATARGRQGGGVNLLSNGSRPEICAFEASQDGLAEHLALKCLALLERLRGSGL